jgi:hypothetical protein
MLKYEGAWSDVMGRSAPAVASTAPRGGAPGSSACASKERRKDKKEGREEGGI